MDWNSDTLILAASKDRMRAHLAASQRKDRWPRWLAGWIRRVRV
jgi:hypothetical protein